MANIPELLISSSSSSSESEEENHFLEILGPELLQHRVKNENYEENIVPLYTNKEFVEHFRVSRDIVNSLAAEFETSEFYSDFDTGHVRITPKKCLVMFCWYAGHEAVSFRDVADRFNIAISTLYDVIERVSYFLSNKSKDFIKWPSAEEKDEILDDFRNMGFPNVLGCLDGMHVRIDRPSDDPDSYYNRKKFFSIQVQALCDSRNKIRDIFIGYPGSVHDSRVFKTSPLYQTLETKCEDKYILADSAYPCLRNCLTPYKDYGNLTASEKYYNSKLSKCRVVIEHTFGMLKQKFRQLFHLKFRNMEKICHFIRACCVLHNMTLLQPDELEYNIEIVEEEQMEERERNIPGHNFRDYVASVLYNNR